MLGSYQDYIKLKQIGKIVTDADILKARAEGRLEALKIILEEDPESVFESCISTGSLGDTGDYSSWWDELALRKRLKIDDTTDDPFLKAEEAYYQAMGEKDEAERALAFLKNSTSERVRAALGKHGEWDLLAALCSKEQSIDSIV
jgi:hypothetical protein